MRGFSLIEMLVVAGIIAVLSGITMVGIRSSEKSLLLDRSAHQVANNIRLVLERAIQSEFYECTTPGPINFSGFGLLFKNSTRDSYIFYADCNNNHKYDNAITNNMNPDELIMTFELEDGVRIQSVDPFPRFNLVFVAPDPDIYIFPAVAPSQVEIVLELISNTAETKTITVNERGAITID